MQDTVTSSYHKDLNFMDLKDITDRDEEEEEILLKHCFNNYETIKDIYHWLQGRSRIYPWVDNYTFREQFIKRLGLDDKGSASMNKVDVILTQVNFKDRFEGKIDRKYVDLPKGISRFMFVEILVRIAKFIYSTHEGHTKQEIVLHKIESNQKAHQVDRVKVSQAFYAFVNERLKPFHRDNKIEYNAFR